MEALTRPSTHAAPHNAPHDALRTSAMADIQLRSHMRAVRVHSRAHLPENTRSRYTTYAAQTPAQP